MKSSNRKNKPNPVVPQTAAAPDPNPAPTPTPAPSATHSGAGNAQPDPTSEEIGAAAYALWEQEGRPDGRDQEHWLQAEAMLRLRAK